MIIFTKIYKRKMIYYYDIFIATLHAEIVMQCVLLSFVSFPLIWLL